MNINVIAVIISYLKINEASDLFEIISFNKENKNIIILHLAKNYNCCYFNMNAKINNIQYRCGKCNNNLINDFSIKQGFNDCSLCHEKRGFNIELCNKCTGLNIKRGEIVRKICHNHTMIYYGVNLLSF